jgi:biofilm PGA synthesis protein PgaA
VHNLRHLSVASGFGRSSGDSPAGSDDWRLQARLYGAPIEHRWRLFGQTSRSEARFDTGATRWHREGLGIEWRAPALRASAAVTIGSADRTGLEAGIDWRPTDHWSLALSGSSVTSNLPMQAWRAGVRAAELAASVRHAADESRSFTLGLARLAFSDGNDRTAYLGTWHERWVSEPYWRLETVAWLGGSENSADGRPYFNPGRDLTASVELAADWLTWRRYERSFRQRLAVTGGSYSQQGYGSDPLLGVAYEHVWDLDRRLHLRYGVGRLLRPYDGESTGRTFGSVALDWRF